MRGRSILIGAAVALVLAVAAGWVRAAVYPLKEQYSTPVWVQPPDLTTYRSVTTVAAPIGDFYELRGIAGTVGRITKVIVGAPNTSCVITGYRRSTQNTGGSPFSITLAKNDSTDSVAAMTAKVWSGTPPAAGTSAGTVLPGLTYSTTSVGIFTAGEAWAKPIVIRSGESFALASDTTLTAIPVFVEWAEATQ